MKRLVIFTLLFPLLVFLVFITPDAISTRDFNGSDFLWLLAWAYTLALVPAWLIGALDSALSTIPLYFRFVVTSGAGAIMALLTARYGFGQKGDVVYFGLMGAIPAAVCPWLLKGWTDMTPKGSAQTRD
jgi:hypothetical protein